MALDSTKDEVSVESTPGATERVLVVGDPVLEVLPRMGTDVDNTEAPWEEVVLDETRDDSADGDISVKEVGPIRLGSVVTGSNKLDEYWADVSEIEMLENPETSKAEPELETSKLAGLKVLAPASVL